MNVSFKLKKIIIISLFLIISITGNLLSQNNAIVIKHIGEQDKSIYPLVITNYEIDKSFSDNYLKYMDGFKRGPIYGIDTIKVINEIFNYIDSSLRLNVDTSIIKRNRRYGSFVLLWIENDRVVKRIETNDRNKSLQLFYKLSETIKRMDLFKKKYELLKAIDGKICRMYFQDEGCNPPPNNIKSLDISSD